MIHTFDLTGERFNHFEFREGIIALWSKTASFRSKGCRCEDRSWTEQYQRPVPATAAAAMIRLRSALWCKRTKAGPC